MSSGINFAKKKFFSEIRDFYKFTPIDFFSIIQISRNCL